MILRIPETISIHKKGQHKRIYAYHDLLLTVVLTGGDYSDYSVEREIWYFLSRLSR